jgi:hypothetical protein
MKRTESKYDKQDIWLNVLKWKKGNIVKSDQCINSMNRGGTDRKYKIGRRMVTRRNKEKKNKCH